MPAPAQEVRVAEFQPRGSTLEFVDELAQSLGISEPLIAVRRFWVDGLGLDVLFRADSSAEGGHPLLMVGWPDTAWHLELVSDPGGETPATPTEEDLLVLYLNGEIDAGVVRRLVDAGGAW